MTALKIVAISDTHGHHEQLIQLANVYRIEADVLLYCGDVDENIDEFQRILHSLPQQYKLIIPGNHDDANDILRLSDPSRGIFVLYDTSAFIQGVSFFGTPWCICDGNPSTRPRDRPLRAYCDVLVTHIPPSRILDLALDWRRYPNGRDRDIPVGAVKGNRDDERPRCPQCTFANGGEIVSHRRNYCHWGSLTLRDAVQNLRPAPPRFHFFGHVHDEPGERKLGSEEGRISNCHFVNASLNLQNRRKKVFPPRVFQVLKSEVRTMPFCQLRLQYGCFDEGEGEGENFDKFLFLQADGSLAETHSTRGWKLLPDQRLVCESGGFLSVDASPRRRSNHLSPVILPARKSRQCCKWGYFEDCLFYCGDGATSSTFVSIHPVRSVPQVLGVKVKTRPPHGLDLCDWESRAGSGSDLDALGGRQQNKQRWRFLREEEEEKEEEERGEL